MGECTGIPCPCGRRHVLFGDCEAPAISITFEGAKTVIGVETLESPGLKLDPTTGTLEFTSPKGLAYFHQAVEKPSQF